MTYIIDVGIKGTSPLLQHRFPLATLGALMEGARRKTGATDYSMEWLDTIYTRDGLLVQPATHIEGALVKAASGFRIKGSKNKTYKDVFRAYVLVGPDEIPHTRDGQTVAAPGPELLTRPTDDLCVNVQRVIINRAAVARARLQVAAGWELVFAITVNDDQIRPEVVETILEEAGRAVGIGDYRPRYGRFAIQSFTPRGALPAV
jgi:hypothetical protein